MKGYVIVDAESKILRSTFDVRTKPIRPPTSEHHVALCPPHMTTQSRLLTLPPVCLPSPHLTQDELSQQYNKMIPALAQMARSMVRDLDPQNDLEFLRIRSYKAEIMVAPRESSPCTCPSRCSLAPGGRRQTSLLLPSRRIISQHGQKSAPPSSLPPSTAPLCLRNGARTVEPSRGRFRVDPREGTSPIRALNGSDPPPLLPSCRRGLLLHSRPGSLSDHDELLRRKTKSQ